MNKGLGTILGLALAVTLGTSPAYAQSNEELKDEVKALRSEVATLRAELQDIREGATASANINVTTPKAGGDAGAKLQAYGFINMQYIHDSQRTSDGRQAMWVLRDMPTDNNDSETHMHPRLTRLGVKMTTPEKLDVLWDATIEAKIEVDFFGGGSESRNLFRMRHAYVQTSWDNGLSFLAGQTSDIISPLYPDSEPNVIGWNGGNLGDRRPQFRVTWDFTPAENFSVQLAGGIMRTEAVGVQDLDANGIDDGQDSDRPMFQGRIGVKAPSWVEGKRIEVGVSGHVAEEETTFQYGPGLDDEFTSNSVSVDAIIPIWKGLINEEDFFEVRGEWFTGKNLNDVRGGIGQGINATTGDEIEAEGGWVQGKYMFNNIWDIAGGYCVDNPDDHDLPTGGRLKNTTWYITNNFHLSKNYLVSFRYLNMETDYVGNSAENDRFMVMFQWNF